MSQATVATYMIRHRRPLSQTWRTFLTNHATDLVAADFFVVPTPMFRVVFVFVVLAHDRRRPVHVAVIAHPTAEWTTQQLRDAFPWDTAPRYLLRDRDSSLDSGSMRPRAGWGSTRWSRRRMHPGRTPTSNTEHATRVSGGVLRLRTSPKTALEVSVDYRSHLNENLTERIKDYPIQGSLLLYPARTVVSPYLVGGIGWYSQKVDALQDDQVIASTTTRKTGYYAGLGTDISIGRHATIHADYRYTFIGFGHDADTAPAAVPIPGLRGLQDRLGLSHKGSM